MPVLCQILSPFPFWQRWQPEPNPTRKHSGAQQTNAALVHLQPLQPCALTTTKLRYYRALLNTESRKRNFSTRFQAVLQIKSGLQIISIQSNSRTQSLMAQFAYCRREIKRPTTQIREFENTLIRCKNVTQKTNTNIKFTLEWGLDLKCGRNPRLCQR